MHGADFLFIGVIALSVIIGIVRGFVREAVSLFSWLLAVWLAWRHSEFLYPWLGGHLDTPELKAWAARTIVFTAVILIGGVVGFVASRIAHRAAGLSVVDRFLGFLFGLVRGMVLLGLAGLLAITLRLDHEPWWQQAQLHPYVEYVAEWVETFAGQHHAAANDALDELDAAAEQQQVRLQR